MKIFLISLLMAGALAQTPLDLITTPEGQMNVHSDLSTDLSESTLEQSKSLKWICLLQRGWYYPTAWDPIRKEAVIFGNDFNHILYWQTEAECKSALPSIQGGAGADYHRCGPDHIAGSGGEGSYGCL